MYGISITSEAGERCVFASPWSGSTPVSVVHSTGRGREDTSVPITKVAARSAEVWSFATKAGGRYFVKEGG